MTFSSLYAMRSGDISRSHFFYPLQDLPPYISPMKCRETPCGSPIGINRSLNRGFRRGEGGWVDGWCAFMVARGVGGYGQPPSPLRMLMGFSYGDTYWFPVRGNPARVYPIRIDFPPLFLIIPKSVPLDSPTVFSSWSHVLKSKRTRQLHATEFLLFSVGG